MTEKKPSNPPQDRLEQFERHFVFRTARGYFLFIALIAILMFVGGVVTGARGIIAIEPSAPAEPVPPPEPEPPPAPTLEDVHAWIERQQQAPTSVASAQEPEWVSEVTQQRPDAHVDPEQQRFRELLEELKSLFPEPTYTWEDRYLRECVRTSPYGCLRYERRVAQAGVSDVVDDALRESGRSAENLNPILTVLVAVLKEAPLEQRLVLVAPTAEAYRESHRDYQSELRDYRYTVADLELEYEEKLAQYEEEIARLEQEKSELRESGVYAVLAGLSLLVLVSVFLAHFAIERHLRLLRELLSGRDA